MPNETRYTAKGFETVTVSHTEVLARILSTLASRVQPSPGQGRSLWRVVGQLMGSSSGISADLCKEFGRDPDLYVQDLVWVDAAKEAVFPICGRCGGLLEEAGAACSLRQCSEMEEEE